MLLASTRFFNMPIFPRLVIHLLQSRACLISRPHSLVSAFKSPARSFACCDLALVWSINLIHWFQLPRRGHPEIVGLSGLQSNTGLDATVQICPVAHHLKSSNQSKVPLPFWSISLIHWFQLLRRGHPATVVLTGLYSNPVHLLSAESILPMVLLIQSLRANLSSPYSTL